MRGERTQVTMAEVARQAGVALGTASRALSGSPNIAAETRLRVERVAARLNYVVSPEASRLARGVTGRTALIVPASSYRACAVVVEGLYSVLCSAGTDLLLYPVAGPEARRQLFDQLPMRRKVDAVVVVALELTVSESRRLGSLDVPIVSACGGDGADGAHPSVAVDPYGAARQAVDHLLSLGHRRVAMVETVDPNQPRTSLRRSAGYRDLLAERGLPGDETLVVRAQTTAEVPGVVSRLVTLPGPPTALFAHTDELAVGVMQAVHAAGLRVPQDVSVIGMNDDPVAELTGLTTVGQRPFEQGLRAGRTVLGLLRGDDLARPAPLEARVVVRTTTAPPRHGVQTRHGTTSDVPLVRLTPTPERGRAREAARSER